MFRTRKEDSLFDTDTAVLEPVESATVITTSAQAATAAPTSNYTPAQQPARPASAEQPRAAAPNANAFRPNNSAAPNAAADLQRGRIPDAKPASPMTTTINTAAPAASSLQPPAADRPVRANQRILTVGNDILLKGEIATCDRLVIEGKVDATLNDVHTVEIAQTGSFKGSAHIEDAEISGLFEGDLVVRNRLVIYATGKVRGKITYGEIEIERGGELTGEIKTVASQPAAGRAPKSDRAAA